jgi:hypothetical protein
MEAAGAGGAQVAAALGCGKDGRSTGGSGAKASHRFFFMMGTRAMEGKAVSHRFFSWNTKLTERFGTVAYVDILRA